MSTTTIACNATIKLFTCIHKGCHVQVGLIESHADQLRKEGGGFCCPNGHWQGWGGKSDADKEREKRERAEREAARLQARLDQVEAARDHAEAQARGYKGAMTKAKNRAAKGVCPAPGCKRSFADVAAHVRTQHPDLLEPQEATT